MTSYRPQGYASVTPWIISDDTAGVIDFAKAAFGAVELARVPAPPGSAAHKPGGIAHAEVRIGDAVVMMFDSPFGWPKTPAFMRLYVEDPEAVFAAAIAAGATEVTRVTRLGFGDKIGRVRDPFGNIWWLQTHVEDVPFEELRRRWTDAEWGAAMAYVQNSLTAAKPEQIGPV
jgi:PhnB protein